MSVTYGDNFMKERTHTQKFRVSNKIHKRIWRCLKFILVFTNIRWFIACPRLLHWIFRSSNYPFITYQTNLSVSVLSKIGYISRLYKPVSMKCALVIKYRKSLKTIQQMLQTCFTLDFSIAHCAILQCSWRLTHMKKDIGMIIHTYDPSRRKR